MKGVTRKRKEEKRIYHSQLKKGFIMTSEVASLSRWYLKRCPAWKDMERNAGGNRGE